QTSGESHSILGSLHYDYVLIRRCLRLRVEDLKHILVNLDCIDSPGTSDAVSQLECEVTCPCADVSHAHASRHTKQVHDLRGLLPRVPITRRIDRLLDLTAGT